jgi:hypothetical protein
MNGGDLFATIEIGDCSATRRSNLPEENQMRHESKSLSGDVSRPVIFLRVAAVVLAAVCASGIRGSAAGDDVHVGKSQNIDLRFHTDYLVALNQPAEAPQAEAPAMNPLQQRALTARSTNRLKQLALAMHNYHDVNNHFPAAAPLGPDGKTPHSWRIELLPYLEQQALFDQYRMNEPWDSENNKKILERMPDVFRSPFNDARSKSSGYYVFVGPGTIFEDSKGVSIADITDGTSNTLMIVEAKRNTPWTKPEDIPFDPKKPSPAVGGFVKGQFTCALADGSVRSFSLDQVKNQLNWLISRNDGRVLGMNRAGVMQQRRNASRPPLGKGAQARNNLKQLALAMHNYHDAHRHFPPAVVMGPDGKTPHSWRVELLPFLEAANLYQQYDQNQPWDSENNKKVLAQMPPVFHSPYDDPKSTNSGYFVLVGPGTAFEGPEGVTMRDITDGTSNTLMIVENKRNIPWTKPEDISFDPEKPLPELGGFIEGGFNCALADGSARTLETNRVKDELKWLIMRNDGHPITER